MQRWITLTLAAGLLVAAESRGQSARQREFARLQGRWKVVLAEELNRHGEVRERPRRTSWRFWGRLCFWCLDGEYMEGCCRLNPLTTPKSIDLTFAGDSEGETETIRGIYAIRGNTLRLCLDLKGRRPNRFHLDRKADRLLVTLRRAKAARGNGGVRRELVFDGHYGKAVYSVAISPDGKTLAAAGGDRTVHLRDLRIGRKPRVLKGHSRAVLSAAFSPDGKLLATGSEDKTVRLWDVARGKVRGILQGHTGQVSSVTFSPDGKQVASAAADGTVRLWEVATGRQRAVIHDDKGFYCVAFSPDGKTLATGGFNGAVRLWEPASGRLRASLPVKSGAVWSVAFSPDGKTVACGSQDAAVHRWDVATRRERVVLRGHEEAVFGLASAPDGKTLASVSYDGRVRLWGLASPRKRLTLRSLNVFGLLTVAFSPDGKKLAAAGEGDWTEVWRLGQWGK
jgi:uncharacterized protein (TIGR03067 family)